MRERKTTFVFNQEEKTTRFVNKGLPQGGVLSPTLYNIYTSRISRGIGRNVKMVQYADDIAVYSITENLEDAKVVLEEVIGNLENKLNREGLEIEQSKSNILIFNNRADRENRIILEIKGQRIGNVRAAKFLGITLDSKLKFNRHIENVITKTQKSINILRYLCRISWGMETSTALNVYKSYVRSNMDYGLMVYYPSDRKGRDMLEKLQNKGIRVAMEYRNSTPINVMLGEAKIMRI